MTGKKKHQVRSHLHLGNESYDVAIRRFIPGYDAMIRMVAAEVRRNHSKSVIELGAGTGALAEAILGCCNSSTVELFDIDPEMLEQARVRLTRFGARAQFSLRSFDEPFSSCDAFTASLSLHHVRTRNKKAALFRRLYDALAVGGLFVNADVNIPSARAEQDALYHYWARHLMDSGIEEDRAWQYFDEWSAEDTYLPLEDELAELRTIGFEAECVWHDGPINLVVAEKV